MAKASATFMFSKIKLTYIPFFSIISFIVGVIFISCEKEPNQLGNNIFPDSDYFNVKFDSSTVVSLDKVINDSVITIRPSDTIVLLGDYKDDAFGETSSGLFMPMELGSIYLKSKFPVGSTPVSLTLYIKRNSVLIGSASESQSYEMFEILENLDTAALRQRKYYFSNSDLNKYLGGNGNWSKVSQGVYVPNTDSIAFTIDNPTLISKLMSSDTMKMNTDSAFNTIFKGLYISSIKNGKGSITSLNLFNKKSMLALKYSYPRTGKSDTTSLIKYYINPQFGGISVFQHNNTNAEVTTSGTHAFIDGMGGAYSTIQIDASSIGKWRDSLKLNLAINRVELMLTPDLEYLNAKAIDTTQFPEVLDMFIKTDSSFRYETDEIEIGTKYLSGVLNSTTNQYSFNITSYIVHLIKQKGDDKNNYILAVKVRNGHHSAQRVAFNKATPVKLRITYSTLKK